MKSRNIFLAVAVSALCGYGVILAEQQTDTENSQLNNPQPQNCGVDITVPGWLVVNDNDDDDNEQWDFEAEPIVGENDTVQITVTATADKSPATVTVEITAGSDKIESFWAGTLTIDGSTSGSEIDGKEKRSGKKTSFEVPKGKTGVQTLYIEGIKHSDAKKDVKIKAKLVAPQVVDEDGTVYAECRKETNEKETTVYQSDLDADSNNNELAVFTEGSKAEDVIEASTKPDGNWPKRPGKIVMVNDGFGDDIPDWADGFDSASNTTLDSVCGAPITFIPILLERKDPFTDKCTVKFTYSASDPASVSTVGGAGFPDYNYLFTKPSGKLLRIWKKNNDGSMRNKMSVVAGGDYVPDGAEIPWDKLSDGKVAHLWVEAVSPSGGVADISVETEVKEDGAKSRDKVNFTAIKITCEPISKKVDAGLYPVNPSGVVASAPGKFEIKLEPSDYPDSEIKWTPVAGGGTVTPETGRSVSFTNTANTSQLIYPQILGNYYQPPRFQVETYSDYRDVDIHAYVVSGIPVGSTTRIRADDGLSLASIVSQLNESYRQVGVRCTLASVDLLPASYDSYFYCSSSAGGTLVDHTHSSGGIEMYVVYESPGAVGRNYNDAGLLIATHGSSAHDIALTSAHEIGHEGGLEDIYDTRGSLTFGGYRALAMWNPDDWPADDGFASDPSFYERMDVSSGMDATRQTELMRRQVMYGVDLGDDIDFASGRVRGVGGGYSWDPESIRDGKVGLLDFDYSALIHH